MKLSEKVPRYSVAALHYTCSMSEFGAFSGMHQHRNTQYINADYVPPNKSGLYCATFVKDDAGSEHMAKVLDASFKRILRTHWNAVQGIDDGRKTRFCVYRIKEEGEA